MQRVLTINQIKEAKQLRKQGYTKKKLAELYGIGETTIWENIFTNRKRVRVFIYSKKTKPIRQVCENCEVYTTKQLNYKNVPINYQMGNKCLACYLERNGLKYKEVFKQ